MVKMLDIVYVAGPYTAPDAYEREANIREAEAASTDLILAGFSPICVHTMSRYWHGLVPEPDCIVWGMRLLEMSDAVMLCEGWRGSKGTLAEVEAAKSMGIPVFEHLEDLLAWRRSRMCTVMSVEDAVPRVPRR